MERGDVGFATSSASSGTGPIVDTIWWSEEPFPYVMNVWWIWLCWPVCAWNRALFPWTPRITPALAAEALKRIAARTAAKRTARPRLAVYPAIGRGIRAGGEQ